MGFVPDDLNFENDDEFHPDQSEQWDNDPLNDSNLNDNNSNNGDFNNGTCHICSQPGHIARECPSKRTLKCRICESTDHLAKECPDKPPTICRTCQKEGHNAVQCKERRRLTFDVPELTPSEAWDKMMAAANEGDITDFSTYFKSYAISMYDIKSLDLVEFEKHLRHESMPIYLIAQEKEIDSVHTIISVDGRVGMEYVLTFQKSARPMRKKFAQSWPKTPEENFGRLPNCGFVIDRQVTKCLNCGELGHPRKFCKKESTAPDRIEMMCSVCNESGHIARYCPNPLIDKSLCRRCKQPGHSSQQCTVEKSNDDIECRKCHQTGHFAKDCPNPRSANNVECHKCHQTGHFARDCSGGGDINDSGNDLNNNIDFKTDFSPDSGGFQADDYGEE